MLGDKKDFWVLVYCYNAFNSNEDVKDYAMSPENSLLQL